MHDDIFLNKMRDVARLCDKYRTARFSAFLDAREQELLKNNGISGTLFGGYEGAERRVLGVFPDWQEVCFSEYPIDLIKFTPKFDISLSHRQYLGTILSLGIERDKIGDILAEPEFSYVFLSSDISEFVAENVKKVGRCGVFAEFADIKSCQMPQKKFEIISAIVASMRLDAVISGILNKSRNDVKNMILSGRVSVNHFETEKTDFIVKEGDLLSIRGFGRAEIFEIGNKTRSDKIHITYKKYI
ncbi:MAG: hypothetical protein IJR79_01290 [Clostridia bacterium]|nr:hypothetical protein [Clostridia bacterium]